MLAFRSGWTDDLQLAQYIINVLLYNRHVMKHRKHRFHFQAPKGENDFGEENTSQVGSPGVGAWRTGEVSVSLRQTRRKTKSHQL